MVRRSAHGSAEETTAARPLSSSERERLQRLETAARQRRALKQYDRLWIAFFKLLDLLALRPWAWHSAPL